jgi:hypothetical protein
MAGLFGRGGGGSPAAPSKNKKAEDAAQPTAAQSKAQGNEDDSYTDPRMKPIEYKVRQKGGPPVPRGSILNISPERAAAGVMANLSPTRSSKRR